VKDIDRMTHSIAAGTLRRLEFRGEGSQEERLALAVRALQTSPPEWAHVWRKRAEIYATGRTVKVLVGDLVSWDGITDEMVDEVESAFAEDSTEGEES